MSVSRRTALSYLIGGAAGLLALPTKKPKPPHPHPTPTSPPVVKAQGGTVAARSRLYGFTHADPQRPAFIIGASSDGTHFVDQYGHPRLFVGEDNWAIVFSAGAWNGGNWQATLDTYLDARQAQGYNAVEISCFSYPNPNVEITQEDGRDWDDVWPFTSTDDPSSGVNETFWTRRDYFFTEAKARGMTVVCNVTTPSLADVNTLCAGWTNTQWTDFGTLLGNRYRNQPNILWITGDDYFGTSDTGLGLWLTALRATGDTHLVSIQNMQESTSRYAYNPTHDNDPNTFDVNAQFNWVYTYNPSYNGVTYAQQHEPSGADVVQGQVPPVWGDGFYLASSVGAGQTDVRLERQNIWWALSSGACGFSTGDNGIWVWGSTSQADVTGKTIYNTWIPAIVDAFESLPGWWKLISDFNNVLVTAGRGTRATDVATGSNGYIDNTDAYVSASRAADESLAVIYCAQAFNITIDQNQMANGYTATWMDPVTGATTAGTPGSTYNSGSQGNNNAGDPDWVLVLQG